MDIQLSYVVAGSGFPLVLLHGNGEDHSYFKRQFEPFAQHYRVIAPDTRGHGHTPRGTAPFTLDQFAEDLKGFLDGMDIGRCHLLGFSDGGNIALLFALKYPEYVEKLVVNGANLFPAGLLPRERLHDAAVWTALQPARLLCPRARKKWELLDLMVSQPQIDPELCRGCRRCQRECANSGLVFDEETRKMTVDLQHCVGCGRCLGSCNFDAISFASGNAVKVLNCRMAEYTKAVVAGRDNFHISLVCDISPVCDCHSGNDAPILPDIGMFASFDPLALDQACVDLVYRSEDPGKSHLIERMESRNGIHIVETAVEIGIGSREYELVEI